MCYNGTPLTILKGALMLNLDQEDHRKGEGKGLLIGLVILVIVVTALVVIININS
jgi:hypothetical protein